MATIDTNSKASLLLPVACYSKFMIVHSLYFYMNFSMLASNAITKRLHLATAMEKSKFKTPNFSIRDKTLSLTLWDEYISICSKKISLLGHYLENTFSFTQRQAITCCK
uniref:Uncharacterized protein n=1 Tax=Rhizophora mucronata TaxID=61149 RepID=A0A2P2INK6_RHIMU